MSDALLPVLWLYGPPGVGKSTVAWELFTQLSGSGTPTGYVDLDQLGMCYPPPTLQDWTPEPASDPGRHRIQARNLDAAVANFHAAGARCVVVSGVVDAARGPDVDLVPHAALTLVRLRGAPDELRHRLAGRGGSDQPVDRVLEYADALDRLNGLSIDTTGRSVPEVVRLVWGRTGGWPGPTVPREAPLDDDAELTRRYRGPVATPGEVLWLCGATAVGKSTVGWEIYQQVRGAGFRAAFVDLDQIGFYRPTDPTDAGNQRLKAANLAALWQNFSVSGAQRLIIVGPVDQADSGRIPAALPATTITLCRLHASRDQITERVMLRRSGQGPVLAGDELKGRPVAMLHRVADAAAADAEALDLAAVGDLRIDTTGRSVHDIAQQILRHTGLTTVRRA